MGRLAQQLSLVRASVPDSSVDRNFYRFRSEWNMTAPPDDVYRALVEIDDYPTLRARWPCSTKK